MSKLYWFKHIVVFLLPVFGYSQISFNTDQLEEDFIYDLDLYAENYLDPSIDAFGFNLANGFQNSASVLPKWGLSFGFVGSATLINDNQLTFDFNEQPFTDRMRLAEGYDPDLPTVFGGSADQELIYEVSGNLQPGGVPVAYEQRIDAFSGIRLIANAFPNAIPQVHLGLPFNFELVGRYMPPIRYKEVAIQQFGIGLRHDFAPYLFERSDVWGLSASAGYAGSRFSYKPDDLIQGENQEIVFNGSSVVLEAAGAYQFKFIELLVQAGYKFSSADFNVNGTYRYEINESVPLGNAPVFDESAFEVTDPVSIDLSNSAAIVRIGANIQMSKWMELAAFANASRYFSAHVSLRFNLSPIWLKQD